MRKLAKNLFMASSMLLLGSTVYAANIIYGDYSFRQGHSVIDTEIVETKDMAYSLGFQKLNDLKLESGSELSDEFALRLDSFEERNSVTLQDGAYITVKELMNEEGDIVFKGQVSVSYSYYEDTTD